MKNTTILALIVVTAIVLTSLYVDRNIGTTTTESNLMPVNGIMALNDTYYLSDPIKISSYPQDSLSPSIYGDDIYYYRYSNRVSAYDLSDDTTQEFTSSGYGGINNHNPSVGGTFYVRPIVEVNGGVVRPYYYCPSNNTWLNINPTAILTPRHFLNPTIATSGDNIAYIHNRNSVYLYNSITETTTQLPMPFIVGGITYTESNSIVMDNTRVVFDAKLGSLGVIVVYNIADGTNQSLPYNLGTTGSLRCLEDDLLAFHILTAIGGQLLYM